jgi:uncharacterized protein YjbJ (UPF0337 family)
LKVVGTLTADDHLRAERQADEIVGKIQAAVDLTSRKAGEAITDVGKAVKKG